MISATPTTCSVAPNLVGSQPNMGPTKLMNKLYVPTLTAAVTKISPNRLSQAVAQPQPLPPRIELQWYRPPAVGNAEATWAMHRATINAKPKPIGQTMP